MDILEKIELFLGEEISGTPATTTGDVAKVPQGTKVMRRKKKEDEDDDSEEEAEDIDKKKRLKSGSQAFSGMSYHNSI